MLPSGDNIASTLGRWASGSESAFLKGGLGHKKIDQTNISIFTYKL